MKTPIKYIIILCLGLFAQTIAAQDLRQDLKKMHQAYKNIENLEAKIVSKEFEEGSLPEVEIIYIKKQQHHYIYHMATSTMLMNDSYLLAINAKEKRIFCTPQYQPQEESSKKLLMNHIQLNLDSLLASYENITFVELKDGLKHYKVEQADADITKIEVAMDAETYLLKKITYTYNEEDYGKTWLELSFPIINTKPVFNTETFSESKYIKKVKGGYQLTTAYQNYELIVTR